MGFPDKYDKKSRQIINEWTKKKKQTTLHHRFSPVPIPSPSFSSTIIALQTQKAKQVANKAEDTTKESTHSDGNKGKNIINGDTQAREQQLQCHSKIANEKCDEPEENRNQTTD